jgi:phosphoribosylaminoimidazole-succinocarboxamide synthase
LNQTAAWWFNNTQHIIPNAVLAVPDPNVTIMKKCTVFPVEFVVRGFMTGVCVWGEGGDREGEHV